jgi:hypothetical protein
VAIHDILDKRHYRRTFYLLVLFLGATLILIRYFVIPLWDSGLSLTAVGLLARLVEALLASLVVTVAIGWFVFWLTPDIMKISAVNVIEPREIGPLLESAMIKSQTWWYKGGIGRYLRAKTIPDMAKHARNSSLSREINVLILDPQNTTLCEAYANYRRSLKSAGEEVALWTSERVQRELYATILFVAATRSAEPLLRITLGLTEHLSSFRFDLSSDYVIVTKEDKTAPAVRCDKGTYFYNSYFDEMVLIQRMAKPLVLPATVPPLATITRDQLRAVFAATGCDYDLDESAADDIIALARGSKNPYE